MINSFSDDLLATSWLGEVVDIEDPQKIGRVRIKVYGKFDDIPKDSIPWAYPGNNMTAGSKSGGGFFSVPKLGSVVSVKFDMGNIYHPEYFFQQKISDETKAEIKDSYANAHVLLYDTVTAEFVKIYFTEKKGLMLDYKTSIINILPDKSIVLENASKNGRIEMLDDGTLNITQKNDINIKGDAKWNVTIKGDTSIKVNGKTSIDTKGNTLIKSGGSITIDHASSISLGQGAAQSLVLGEKFMALYNAHTHTGNLGAPTSPPGAPMTPAQLTQKSVKTL